MTGRTDELRLESVAVVIPCHGQAQFLAEAIESALEQSVPPAEIIVVDDGKQDDVAAVAGRFAQVALVRRPHRGLASARNAGLRASQSDKVIFLDSDDRLLPTAVEAGLRAHRDNPGTAFVYGGYRLASRGREQDRFRPAATRPELIQCNWIGMIGTVMFDRLKLVEIGGFDVSLGMCEDWDVYLRLTRKYAFASHPEIVARYVRHRANMSNDRSLLRCWTDVVREKERQRALSAEEERAWQEGRAIVRSAHAGPVGRVAARIARALRGTKTGLRTAPAHRRTQTENAAETR